MKLIATLTPALRRVLASGLPFFSWLLSDSIGARAQSCASSIYEATLTFQSERLPIQLNGFFPYLPIGPNSADTTPAIKYATESLTGRGNFIDPACGCFTDHTNINYYGSWNFSVADFTDQSTKTAISQVFGCVTGAGGAANVKIGLGDGGHGYYFPGPNSGVTATRRSFISNFTVQEVTPPSCVTGSPRFYQSSLGEALSDVVEISQAKTRAETAKTIINGAGNRQYWSNNYPATAGEAANLIAAGQLSRTSPILCPAERISFRAQFSDLCAGRYLITYYYKKWAIGTPEPDLCETPINEEVEFKDAPFLVPNTETGFRAYPFPLKQGEQCILARVTAQKMDDCKDRSAGDSNQQNNSVDMRFFLGKRSGGSSAGSLGIYAAKVVPALYTPGALTLLAAENPEVIVAKQNSVLRQIKAPECTADIVTVSPSSYEVRFYRPGQTGALDSGTGVYALNGLPYTTYLVENPDSGLSTRIRFIKTSGGAQKTTVFASSGDARNGTTDMTTGNGLRTESLERVTSSSTVTETRTIKDAGGQVVSLLRETKTIYPFGAWVTESTVDTSLTTQTRYYTDPVADGGAFGQVRDILEPSLRWTRYTYDAQGRPLTIVTQYRSYDKFSPDNFNRVTSFSYGTIPDQDGDGLPEKLTTEVKSLIGREIGRSYQVVFSLLATVYGRPIETFWAIQCTAAGAAWNAPGGLVTKRRAIASGDWLGRPISELRPDGTLTTYTYVLGSTALTTTTDTGQADPTGSTVASGTRTVDVTSIPGKAVSSTVSDIASNLLLSAEAVTQADSFGRPTRTDFLDGTYELRSYACCGLDSFTDRQGITTTYTYNALGYVTGETRSGITIGRTLDPLGRVLVTTRTGTDGSSIVTETNHYNGVGQLDWTKDALNRQTRFYGGLIGRVDGFLTATTVLPEGGERYEIKHHDGYVFQTYIAHQRSISEYSVEADGPFVKTGSYTKTRSYNDTETLDWVKTYSDFAGRNYKTLYADGAFAQSFFNNLGQLSRQVDPDGVTTLYAYNARGELEYTALDLNQNGVIDFDGADRVTRTQREVVTARGFTVLRTTTTAWTTPGAATTQVVSIVESTPDGSRTWQTVNGLTTQTVRSYGANATRTETTTAPDGTISTRQFQNDRLISNAVSHPALGQLAATTLSYDTHGRLQTSTDARAGATTYTYFADDQPQTITSPDPDPTRTGPGYDPQVTRYAYDAAGRVNLVTQPDGATVSTLYYFSGQIKQVSGSRTYPVEYAYDTRGQLQTLKTWTNFAAGIFGDSVTTFNYDQKRGWLASKEAPGAANTFYTYYPSGRIKTRSSNRANAPKATHVYNTAGDLSGITYSESTPAVAFTYDRLGRPLTTTDASGTCTWSYHVSGQRQNETYGTTGLLANLGLTRSFDSLDRLSGVAAFSLGSRLSALGYSYDPSSRLQTLTVGPNVATYAYLPNSSLVSTITVSNSGAVRLTTAKTYDNLNRLASTVSTPSTSPIVSSAYTYNAANQRTKTTLADGQSWNYAYDALGQVTSAKKTLATGATLGGHDFAYTYDDLGNRKTTTTNGQSSVYTNAAPSPSDSWASVPNVYAERTVPGVVDVTGTANPAASVVVNQADAQRQGDAFYRAVPVDNTAAPVYLPVEIVGVRNNAGPAGEDAVTTQTRSAFVPQARELYTHDHNLTADGRWLYTWDAENRLTAMETQTAAVTAGVPKQKLEFSYDAQSRRVAKKVSNWSGTAYTVAIETRFIYDGWNLLAEVNALAANTPIRTYVWGLDLSGSTQGAGGVGGLLAVNSGTSTYAAAYDGNGNVSALVNAADGTLAARYDYNAFGERVLTDGPAALLNPFRFSTKYEDPESGLLYYGFRYYNPSTGRWPSRDPIEEQGGVNLYGFVGNDPVGSVDVLGLAGYFFDGTGNSPKSGTNVLILHDAYDGLAFYYRGVGSSFGTRAVGGLTGAGGSNRLEDAYRDFIRAIDSGDRYVDIVGFSRGAALAREFANLLNERGYDPSYGGKLKHKLRAGTNKPPGECEFVIRFVGLFDTVGSFGVPGNDTNIGIRMDLPGTVGNAAQATAQNERRFLFPLTPLGDREGFDEQGFPGDHSDIGRGHGKGTNDLSRAPLEYMWNQGRAAGAPFGSLPQYTPTGNTTPHDLSRKFPHNLFPKRTR